MLRNSVKCLKCARIITHCKFCSQSFEKNDLLSYLGRLTEHPQVKHILLLTSQKRDKKKRIQFTANEQCQKLQLMFQMVQCWFKFLFLCCECYNPNPALFGVFKVIKAKYYN